MITLELQPQRDVQPLISADCAQCIANACERVERAKQELAHAEDVLITLISMVTDEIDHVGRAGF